MKKLIGTLAVLALAMSGLTFVTGSTAFAASACQSASTLTSSQTTAAGGSQVVLTATIKDCNGGAVSGATVTFSQASGPCQSTFSSTTAVTDANGKASVTVTLPANCPGQYTFNAGTQGINVQAAVVESGGFPATSAPASSPSIAPWLLALGALMVLAGAGAMVLRRRAD